MFHLFTSFPYIIVNLKSESIENLEKMQLVYYAVFPVGIHRILSRNGLRPVLLDSNKIRSEYITAAFKTPKCGTFTGKKNEKQENLNTFGHSFPAAGKATLVRGPRGVSLHERAAAAAGLGTLHIIGYVHVRRHINTLFYDFHGDNRETLISTFPDSGPKLNSRKQIQSGQIHLES